MPTQIDVDTANEIAKLTFVDSHGNETPVPAGATITFSTSDPNVLSATSTVDFPQIANLTPVGTPGNVDVSVAVDGAFEPDGVTPIPIPDPVTITVTPGAAVGERLSVEAQAPPAPGV